VVELIVPFNSPLKVVVVKVLLKALYRKPASVSKVPSPFAVAVKVTYLFVLVLSALNAILSALVALVALVAVVALLAVSALSAFNA